MSNSSFNSKDYWKNRHLLWRDDPRGVGNASLSNEENQVIYHHSKIFLVDFLNFFWPKKQLKILDLGCGTGMMSSAFTDLGHDYTGIDISDLAINFAKKNNPNGNFFVSDITSIPLESKYDLIFERTVFIHLVEDRNWLCALSEVKRLLHFGGSFIINDYLKVNSNNSVEHVKLRTYETYKNALNSIDLDFDIIRNSQISGKFQKQDGIYFVQHINV